MKDELLPATLRDQDGHELAKGKVSLGVQIPAGRGRLSFYPSIQPITKTLADRAQQLSAILRLETDGTCYLVSAGQLCTAPHYPGDQHIEFDFEPMA